MNWFKKSYKIRKHMFDWSLQCCGQPHLRKKDPYKPIGSKRSENLKDQLEKMLGLGKYKPKPITKEEREKRRKNRKPRDSQHSMDMGEYEGDDDGW